MGVKDEGRVSAKGRREGSVKISVNSAGAGRLSGHGMMEMIVSLSQ